MSQDNIAVVRRWFDEVWNQRRADLIDELLAPESVCHADDGPLRGPAEFRERQYTPFLAAFPDLRVEVEATVAQGDQVVVRWTAAGRHAGDGLGFRATRDAVTFRGITWIRVRDGKLAEGWQHTNIPDVVRKLAERAPS
jgi:steroid delta-isomerase-like uncharacterized protein